MQRNIFLVIILILVFLGIWFLLAPPQFLLNLVKRVDMSNPVMAGQTLVERYQCKSCHPIGDEGRIFGPRLDGVTRRMPADQIRMWLLTPKKVNPGTAMPDLNLSEQEVEAILRYLESLDNSSNVIPLINQG